jgi:hypothetical protein
MEYLNTNLAHELDGDLFGKSLYMQTLQMPFLDFLFETQNPANENLS